ncbi:MAG: DNA mismatch repair endonuclease MutL [Bdellovibrionales bacterium]|nr:DNA mismatch repair endonuclease MutL [Bdellovibrionales bacterium]
MLKVNSIHTLPPEVINHIAAGEVVERPANLVKELIENSLDAGADKIEMHFSEGGRFVQIKDNGCGIKDSELNLALSPHSTSKIASLKDIWVINSYGFRGEALASIAEVSDLTLVSKPENQKQAARLKSEFGKKTSVESIGSEKGTTIIVKNLFQNTPARLKFLKSESAETTVIKNTLKAMALPRPHVEFRVLYKNKLLFYWPGSKNLQKRAEEILSLENTFYTKTKYQDINLEAVLCAPNNTVSNRRQMWFFVEGRWVEDATLYSAVMSAYRGLLMHGEYPIVVLNLSCRKEDLDVNVHPAKSKIRFRNSSPVFKAVHNSLRAVLEKALWLEDKKQKSSVSDIKKETELSFPGEVFQQTQFQEKKYKAKGFYLDEPVKSSPLGSRGKDLGNLKNHNQYKDTTSVADTVRNMKITPDTKGDKGDSTSLLEAHKVESQNYWSSLHVLSQAHLTYIIAQTRSSLIFIDQHAAHERVLYERLMFSWNKGKGEIQSRLVPLALDLDASLVTALLSVQKELLKIGVEIELSGPDGVVIHSAPPILKDVALQKSLVQLADEIKSLGGSFAIEKKISDLCASMACHSAVRAGQALSKEEMKELLAQMDEFPLSSFCPHGRPVFVEYPLSRLERDFGRKV